VKGTITRLFKAKGFGFIQGEDNIDRFFHRDGLVARVDFNNLSEGDSVVFEHQTDYKGKGPRAEHVDLA